jgi:hypothetical protein
MSESDADAPDDEDDAEESEWRFGLDDVGEDAEREASMEPGSPTAENVAFVLLGVAVAVVTVYAAIAGF